MADYNSDRTGANIDATLDKVDALVDSGNNVTADGLVVSGASSFDGGNIEIGSSGLTGISRTNSSLDLTLKHWASISALIDSDGNDANNRRFLIGKNSNSADTADKIAEFKQNGDVSFYEDTGTTAKMVWDASAESLGIGTASPSTKLDVVGNISAGGVFGRIRNNDTSNASSYVQMKLETGLNDAYVGAYSGSGGNGYLVFGNENTERARIDSSGNLLVGRTGVWDFSTVNTSGTGIIADGYIHASRDGAAAAYFKRYTTDGSIAEFWKDTSKVGNIGAYSGGAYYTGNTRGLRFDGTQVLPCNDTGLFKDGDTNLGATGSRFKDLYLSGFLYAGETDSSSILPRMTMERYSSGGGSGVFNTVVAGKAQQGMLYAIDTSNGNYLISSLSKFNEANSILINIIDSSGLTVVATNAGGTIQLSSTASTVKMFVTKHILD